MPTAHDDEEDAAPPLKSAGLTAPASVPAPRLDALTWGACSVFCQTGELTAFPGERGVIRYVTSGVRFAQPPTDWEWRAVPAEPGRYELRWPEPPGTARTLAALRRDLEACARQGELRSTTHPLLRELDAAALALVTLVDRLHRADWSLGLVRPDNLVLHKGDIVPVDLGFTWQGAFGGPPWDDSPGRPSWVEPTAPFAWLYDHPPVRQQFAAPNGTFPPKSADEDVRTVGRLLAWLLSGAETRTVPQVREAPPSWEAVTGAANGAIATAAELATALRTAPLSRHFLRSEPASEPPALRRRRLVPAVACICVLGLAAGGGWYALTKGTRDGRVPEPSPIPAPAPALPVDDSFAKAVSDFDATPQTDVPRLFGLLRDAYAHASDDQKRTLASRREKALNAWVAAFSATESAAAEPGRRHEAAARYAALKADLEQLARTNPVSDPDQQIKERQCLEFVSARVREFGSSP